MINSLAVTPVGIVKLATKDICYRITTNKMNTFLLLSLLFGVLFTTSPGKGVMYYVKPSPSSSSLATKCPGQPCETLQYYFDNLESAINQQKNVTMIFLKGTHTTNLTDKTISVTVPELTMKGKSQNVTMNCLIKYTCKIEFGKSNVYLENIVIRWWYLATTGVSDTPMMPKINSAKFAMSSVKLDRSIVFLFRTEAFVQHTIMESGSLYANFSSITFRNMFQRNAYLVLFNGLSATLENCTLINSPIALQYSSLVLLGESRLSATSTVSAIISYLSNVTLSGTILFSNNTSMRGGALALYSSTLNIAAGANVTLVNNSAHAVGGAIYIEPGLAANTIYLENELQFSNLPCFYNLLDCKDGASYDLTFAHNSAVDGGEDVYGALLQSSCHQSSMLGEGKECKIAVSRTSSGVSSVSSDPTRVCICDSSGQPQCHEILEISYEIHPGEIFTVPAVLVGGDFGTTTGIVHTFVPPDVTMHTELEPKSHNHLITDNKQCTDLSYALYTNHTNSNMIMYLTPVPLDNQYVNFIQSFLDSKHHPKWKCYHCSQVAPISLNVTVLPCPPGFTLSEDTLGCDCNAALTDNGVKCDIINGSGYFSWGENMWINIKGDGVVYSGYCPIDYCNGSSKQINLLNNSTSQCVFKHNGTLCGGCEEGYSLAIGSSHCIHCPNNNNLALLIFFVAAGFLLVFFITALDLTVTNGMTNGLIFYANIVWTYINILFPQEAVTNTYSHVLMFLRTFIAWVNLDFGIETCFINGLTAYSKTWLQFVFPLYIWAIAGLIIVATRHSSRLTKLLGNKAVPVLASLILLSYMKLLRIIVSTFGLSLLFEHPGGWTLVWSVDGNLPYFGLHHGLLFLAALATLLFLWLPYTLLLLLMQWLRKKSHLRCLRWITRFHPVYDAYLASLRHEHQYWFGVLLLARGILLVAFTSCCTIPQTINLLALFIIAMVLFFYITITQPYKSRTVHILHSSFLANLIVLSGFTIFTHTRDNRQQLQAIAFGISAGVAYLQFCGILFYKLVIAPRCSFKWREASLQDDTQNTRAQVHVVMDNEGSVGYRDSILDETQPLLMDTPTY